MRRKAELVCDLLNCEAGGVKVALGFAHQVVGDNLLGRLADYVIRYLREVAGGDAEFVGVEGNIVGIAIMFSNKRDEKVQFLNICLHIPL